MHCVLDFGGVKLETKKKNSLEELDNLSQSKNEGVMGFC